MKIKPCYNLKNLKSSFLFATTIKSPKRTLTILGVPATKTLIHGFPLFMIMFMSPRVRILGISILKTT
jgi:hypothetical protein